MKTIILTLAVLGLCAPAFGQEAQKPATTTTASAPATVTFQADPIVINGQGDDEAVLFAMPSNAPVALVNQKTRIEEVRAKLKDQRHQLVELLKQVDFEKPMATPGSLKAAIEQCQAQVVELEAMEAEFLLDRDLHLADATKTPAANLPAPAH